MGKVRWVPALCVGAAGVGWFFEDIWEGEGRERDGGEVFAWV